MGFPLTWVWPGARGHECCRTHGEKRKPPATGYLSMDAGFRGWLRIAMRPDVRRRSLKVALLVGIILAAINYTDRLLAGTMAASDYFKMALTFLVPFAVSTHASVSAILRSGQESAAARPEAGSVEE